MIFLDNILLIRLTYMLNNIFILKYYGYICKS